jgi:hypothetical protein
MIMKNNIKCGFVLVGAFSLIMLSALALCDSSHDSTKLAHNVNQPIVIERNSLLAAYTHEDLNNHSNTIVIGTVK